MRIWLGAFAAVTVAVSGAGVAAWSLDGAYRGESGAVVDFGDGASGSMRVTLPDGAAFEEPYTLEGDVMTIPSAEDGGSPCAGITGAYTVAEGDDGVAFTVVEDACEQRVRDLTAGVWSRVEADAAE